MDIAKRIVCFLLFLFVIVVQSQAIPPIETFTPQQYNAEDQNWSITQSPNNWIYIANNAGLLEYNGASWSLYPSPNNDILRSVHAVDNRIYTGGYMDFGFWQKDEFGMLLYTSLVEEIGVDIREDEEFWGIIDANNYILFQSFERIYIYNLDDKSIRIIDSNVRINKIFQVDESIYFQKRDQGIFKIENGETVMVISGEILENIEIIDIFKLQNELILISRENGFLSFKDGKLSSWNDKVNTLLKGKGIYNSIRLKDGSFALGTISHGLIIVDENKNSTLRINQSSGLSNNTVLSLKEDSMGNLWLGLDNGINVLNLNSSIRLFTDKLGVLGTVYASALLDEYLYLGTNQGLFYKKYNSLENFKFISGTKGQVWSLKVIDNTLFCGHDKGTFIVSNKKANQISDNMGTWNIKEIPGKPNYLLCGKYKGLSILENINDKWSVKNKIEGFDISSRYFEFASSDEILVSHEYKGVYKVKLDLSFSKVLDYSKIKVDHGIKSSIVKYNNAILYCYKDGVFKYDSSNDRFVSDSVLSNFISGSNYLSGKMIYERDKKKLWAFSKEGIVNIEPGNLSNEPSVNTIPLAGEVRKSKPGYENILHLNNNKYLIGTTQGYLIADLDKLNIATNKIDLNSIYYNSKHDKYISLDLDKSKSLGYKNNSLLFKFNVANYNKLSSISYQHRLLGIYDEWSEWATGSEIYFDNLPSGDYEFQARAIIDGVVTENSIKYNFTIEKPWYLSPIAIGFYILSGIVILFLVHLFNRRYYKKQKLALIKNKERELELEQLEGQRRIVEFKNKNLELDIENKNRELGTATMNLVKRNELLNNIKEELTKSKSLNEIKNVVKLINNNLNNTSDWKLFEEAFNSVDKDFMKRVKLLHPSITPNDLRLCAYLRLNLSSKEIAPLLNISHKSVEVKRYRLRKKMGLDHDQSLSNYIIDL